MAHHFTQRSSASGTVAQIVDGGSRRSVTLAVHGSGFRGEVQKFVRQVIAQL